MLDLVSRVVEEPFLPARLRDLPAPPTRVHLVGEVPRGAAVALVGTRTPCEQAAKYAFELSEKLARRGIAVLSGGAEGIDTAAHEGALAAGGTTLVVGASGWQRPFPAKNADLFARVVAAGGGYLALHPDRVTAQQGFFFARNACLAALAHALVVVETRPRGGARNAAKWARRLGRPLLVVPSAPWIGSGAGCIQELRLGAKVCGSVSDILRELERSLAIPAGSAKDEQEAEERAQVELKFDPVEPPAASLGDPEALAVLRAVQAGAVHLDAVCGATGLPPAAAQSHVLTLTLEGVLVAGPTGALGVAPAARPVSPGNISK